MPQTLRFAHNKTYNLKLRFMDHNAYGVDFLFLNLGCNKNLTLVTLIFRPTRRFVASYTSFRIIILESKMRLIYFYRPHLYITLPK